jgi:uncharacterized Zn-binding protein involved in type VI secretion
MGMPAARANDQVTATDTHIVLVPAGPAQVPTPLPHVFAGMLVSALAPTVRIGGQPAAVVGSVAQNAPPHLPTPPGTTFVRPPSNQASITVGSVTVRITGKGAARTGDTATSCNDPADLPVGSVVGTATVRIGG